MTAAIGAVALAMLWLAGPAGATTYTVTGTGDAAGSCGQIVSNAASCDTLRAAVSRANQDQVVDTISLPAVATYTLTQAQAGDLTIGTNITITGTGARTTVIFAATGARVFTVSAGGNLTLSHVMLTGGTSAGSSLSPTAGGDIFNQAGALTLDHVRVTGGTASAAGGGIALQGGSLTAKNSLIDGNTVNGRIARGGGIYSASGSGTTVIPAAITLTNTTVAFNQLAGGTVTGGTGIEVAGNPSTASLTSVTIARNSDAAAAAAGLSDETASNLGSVTTAGTIIAQNVSGATSALSNCSGGLPRDQAGVGEASISDGADCGFAHVADPQLDAALSNQGGETNVLAIPATSPAKRLVADCPVATDQRDAARQSGGACDAGAYEQITPPPVPQPTVSPAPIPTPTATATPPPAPVFHKNVVVRPVSGTVKVKLPGTNKFVDLDVTQNVPLGSTIDVKHGKISLTSVPKAGGKPQTAVFYGGIFKLTQPGGITRLQLNEPLAACPRPRHHATASAAAAKKKPKTRSLWGNGHGSFRTKGQYSAATVRGTKWFVEDSCAGTLTRVAHGVVSVRDEVRHKTITLRAGKRYLARPRR